MTDHAVVDTFIDLVQHPSAPGHERRVADEVIMRLRDLGIRATEDDIAGAIGGDTGNIHAWVPPTSAGEPLLLCAHLDTVEPGPIVRPVIVDGFVKAAEGRVLGADDKAAVAAILDAVRRIVSGSIDHAGIELLFTVQEERGLAGVKAADLAALRSKRALLVDYSGPLGGIIIAAPTYLHVTLVVYGRAAHASQPQQGNNAILAAAAVLCALPSTPEGVTTNVGLIRGGTGLNVVPDRADVALEIRGLPHEAAEGYLAAVIESARKAVEAAGAHLEHHGEELYRAYSHTPDDPSTSLAAEALRSVGIAPYETAALGGSDANALISAGIDATTLTGGMIDIHTPDEHIAVNDLVALSDLLVAAIQHTKAADD